MVLDAGASCLDTSAAPLTDHDNSTKIWVMLVQERVRSSCIERRTVHLIRCRSNTSSRAPLGAYAVVSAFYMCTRLLVWRYRHPSLTLTTNNT